MEIDYLLKNFIHEKIDCVLEEACDPNFSFGYEEAMREVLKFLDDIDDLEDL